MFKLVTTIVLLSGSFLVHAESVISLSEKNSIKVYRNAGCGCCEKWVSHLKQHHFQVDETVLNDVQPIKDKYNVPPELASCHTAVVNGYLVEGHVPAADIQKLLKLKPNVVGIAVPQMPVGTPGMEIGDKKQAYNVISFDKNKQPVVFSTYSE